MVPGRKILLPSLVLIKKIMSFSLLTIQLGYTSHSKAQKGNLFPDVYVIPEEEVSVEVRPTLFFSLFLMVSVNCWRWKCGMIMQGVRLGGYLCRYAMFITASLSDMLDIDS